MNPEVVVVPPVAGRLIEARDRVVLNAGRNRRARARGIYSVESVGQATNRRCSGAVSRTEANPISGDGSGASAVRLNQNASIASRLAVKTRVAVW